MQVVGDRVRFCEIESQHPQIAEMLWKLRQRSPAFAHQVFSPPQKWFGAIDAADNVIAAVGWNGYDDGTIEVRYAVARPSRLGSKMLTTLAFFCAQAWNTRIIFYSQWNNRRMQKLAWQAGCRPIAVLWERPAREGVAHRDVA